MKKRLLMALPLIFAFFLTLLPFGLLEYNQYQRRLIHEERAISKWEQSASNYLQLFRSLWSSKNQVRHRFNLLKSDFESLENNKKISAQEFEAFFDKRFSGIYKPEHLYVVSIDTSGKNVEMFNGKIFANTKKAIFRRLLVALANNKEPDATELKSIESIIRGLFTDIIAFKLLKE